MTALRVIDGGRAPRPTTTVLVSDLEGLRLELVTARAERTVYASRARALIRVAAHHIAAGHGAAAGTALVELERLNEQEALRAAAMDAPECACGGDGAGHGRMDEEALALPERRAA